MKPRIAITMGDPGGIGPEIILKSLMRDDVKSELDPIIIGDVTVLKAAVANLGLPCQIEQITDIAAHDRNQADSIIPVFQPYAKRDEISIGCVSAENGRISHAFIVSAARAVLNNQFDAMCTAPISKEALFAAGFNVPGHTELLAEVCGRKSVRMMLAGGGLRVVLQTIHVSLKEVPRLLTIEAIAETLQIINTFAAATGQDSPTIAVCGLNPHAGEGGHFGNEESEIITPAIENAIARGMMVAGPLPADTVFHRALNGEFDFVLAMYHDQGLIPVKTLDFHGGVNVTLGLPLLRTSPDHGTAFNLAGLGIANESSMVSALKYAATLARAQR